MKLQGRELRINLSGEDVRLLHDELALIGMSVPALERRKSLFGEGTRKAVREFQKKRGLEASGVVDEATAVLINDQLQNPFLVRGTVRHADGKPLVEGLVRAFDRDLRSEEPLGQDHPTDQQGRYEIAYDREKFSRAEKSSADLVMRAYSSADDPKPLAQSRILFNARQEEIIDLVVGDEAYRGPSEFEALVATLMPLLGDGLGLAELREDDADNAQDQHQDVTFLSGESGEDRARITYLIEAHRLLKETGVPAEAFYGMFRQGLPRELPALLAQSPDVQRQALTSAASANVIPARFGKEADALVQQLKAVIVDEAMKPPADGGGTASLNDLLELALPQDELRRDFLTAHVNRTGPIEDFWKELAADGKFSGRIPAIQLILQLGALTGNHPPLVRELKDMLQGDTEEGGFIERLGEKVDRLLTRLTGAGAAEKASSQVGWRDRLESLQGRTRYGPLNSRLVSLAALDEEDWLETITMKRGGEPIGTPPGIPGKDEDERARNYARAIAHRVEDAFPTVFTGQRLETDNLPGKDGLLTFLRSNPEFNIEATRLGSFEKQHPGAFDTIAVGEREPTRNRIRAMQRVYKVAPRYRQMSTLLKSGLDSAQRIIRMGRNDFASSFADSLGGGAQAEAIYLKALDIASIATNIAVDHAPTNGRISLNAVPDETVTEVDGAPEWSTLFGSIELCSCEHCRSVHGPAAYLVDILQYLKHRRSRIPGGFVKDVLLGRRPDIGEIELTCENTNTPLPYVDLVNEALENAVAPYPAFTPFDLLPLAPPGQDFEAQLNGKAPTDEFRNAFNPPLSTEAVISVGAGGKPWTVDPDWWTIDEPGFTYTIRKETAVPPRTARLNVLARSLQAKGSAAERAASPQYFNVNAYSRLARAVYPWSLPFSLWWEEARAYLGHLGVPRHLIMERFRPGERRAILGDAAIACDYLGLFDEAETDNAGAVVHHGTAPIITGVRTADPSAAAASRGPWNLWGFPAEYLTLENSLVVPSDSTRRITGGNWLAVLRDRVDVFLHQSGLKYKELLDLLDTHFVNPFAGNARAIRIVSDDPVNNPGTCETNRLRLEGLDLAAAVRVMRFVRLWRVLGWSMRDLDHAITALGPAQFGVPTVPAGRVESNERFLVQLAHIQRLQSSLKLPVLRLLSWWADIDSDFYVDHDAPGQPRAASLYDQLFRNRASLNPPDPAFTDDPNNLIGTLSGRAAAITAALGITATDFGLLLADRDIIPRAAGSTTQPDDTLSLDTLSRLHRHTSLAKALHLTIREYLAALKLIAADPFATTSDTVAFVETMDKVRESGFSIDGLDYLLRHTFAPESTISPSDDAIAVFLVELRSGLQKIAEEHVFRGDAGDPLGQTTDLNGDLTRQQLALLDWDGDWIEQAIATLNGAIVYEERLTAFPGNAADLPNAPDEYAVDNVVLPTGFVVPAELEGLVAYDSLAQRLTSKRLLGPVERAALRASGGIAVDALFRFQDELRGEISYDAQRRALRFSGPMTDARKTRLDSFSTDGTYGMAVQALYDAPRRFVGRAMRTFSVHDFAEPLAALPAFVRIPSAAKKKIYFDAHNGVLHCRGVMSEQERDALLSLSGDATDPQHAAYEAAVNALYAQPGALVPVAYDAFLTQGAADSDAAALFDAAMAPGDRFLLILKKLLPYLRVALSERFAIVKTAEELQLEARSADALLRTWLVSPLNPQRRCLDELVAPAFVESNANVQPTPAAFPTQFKTFLHVHKASLIASRFNFTHRQLGWLFVHGAGAAWLDLNALPADTQPQPAANAFDSWLRLAELAKLRDTLPQGENALDEILACARAGAAAVQPADINAAKQAWFAAVSRWTRWSGPDLEALLGAGGDRADQGRLDVAFPDGYLGVRLLIRLQDAFDLLRRTGLSAAQAADLAAGHVTLTHARIVRQAVRAKYDEAQWLNLAKPLHDVLREKQRAALVEHLVAHWRLPFQVYETPHPILPPARFDANNPVSGPAIYELQRKLNAAGSSPRLKANGTFGQTTFDAVRDFQQAHGLSANGTVNAATWTELDRARRGFRDADDLFAHFLIDVEMDPCMLTSRIKQALSSVQLFVQRCLMNLEPDVFASAEVDDKWLEWKWMKNYRVWEANRKIFLYPENWIEPELRDDKSPFFRELESELLQGDLTMETAEEAFLHYLEKLDQVARLEVVGTFHQVGEDASDGVDILHVFARTAAIPHVYFYRQRVDSARWTAWERIDLDIEGDHLIPMIWNRRLMLFWPTFTEKVEQPAVRAEGGTLEGLDALNKYWEIRLAWSERKQGRWTDKRLSSQFVGPIPLARPGVDGISLHEDPSSFFFRAAADGENNLYIFVLFEVPAEEFSTLRIPAFRFDGCHAEPSAVTFRPPDPNAWLDDLQVAGVPNTFHYYMSYRENIAPGAGDRPLYLPTPPSQSLALRKTPGTFSLLPYPDGSRIAEHPFFFQDDRRAFFVVPFTEEPPTVGQISGTDEPDIGIAVDSAKSYWSAYPARTHYLFETFYHPHVCAFVRELNRNGVEAMLQRRLQTHPNEFALRRPDGQRLPPLDFENAYGAKAIVPIMSVVREPYPREDLDFDDGAYALYNWELFFHAPFLIADRLFKNQRHEDARTWFHTIFNPTDASSFDIPERYWRTKPFHETTREGYQRQNIQHILDLLARDANPQTRPLLTPEQTQELRRLRNAVKTWRKDPFKPHLIARTRTTAYQKTVVMKYIDNLIAWGDQLFRRDTIESNNEATQLYILAAEILGRRPEDVPPRTTPQVQTYNSLEPKLDDFSNALVAIEEFVSPSAGGGTVPGLNQPPLPTVPLGLYFCVTRNDKLLEKWDTVADRLFKLRHCMNIEGVVRQLPLFEPPIEPGLLVKAVAAGVDLGSVLNDISAGPPHFRFNVLAQKATELCGELKSLGQSMLSVLEKRDAEQLSLLRAGQEAALLGLAEEVRRLQSDEAEENKKALSRSRDQAVGRYIHFQKLLGAQSPKVPGIGELIAEESPSPHVAIQEEGGSKLIAFEKEEMNLLKQVNQWQLAASGISAGASIAYIVPEFSATPWWIGAEFGGREVGSFLSALAESLRARATDVSYQGGKAAKLGQYALRAHEWLLQSNQAAREIMQIDQQYLAAELRGRIAEKELSNHRRQVDNAREIEEILRDKYTNQELYGWMIGQLATVFFQTYQLAYDLAKRAERAFRRELGLQDSNYIQFGYWDGLKKGLLAGERLHHDLKRMEFAYLDQYRREYEITQHVSMRQLDPLALVQLRQTGACLLRLPEVLFDLHYPGHYMRRIRSASVSIPCVTGPYSGVDCTLTLLRSSVRVGSTVSTNGRHARQEGDPRFTDSLGAIQSIVTSSGQDDSGLFETNLRDERYLPFEGAGVISDWQFELPARFRGFDYDTISDVILHLRYTAREGGGLLKQQASLELQGTVNELIGGAGQPGPAQFFSLRHEFPTRWYSFLNPVDALVDYNTMTLGLTPDRFPFLFQGRSLRVLKIELVVKTKPGFDGAALVLTIAAGDTAPTPANSTSGDFVRLAPWNGVLRGESTFDQAPGNWTINAWLGEGSGPSRLDPTMIEDLMLICRYELR